MIDWPSYNKSLVKRSRHIINLSNTYYWIEKLLQTPLQDHRRYRLYRILVPYLVNIKDLSAESPEMVEKWLSKCGRVSPLDFDPSTEIKDRIKYVRDFKP
ncbi:hypothetical protein BH23THE1_BH23THE1_21980 [soil metagenome]